MTSHRIQTLKDQIKSVVYQLSENARLHTHLKIIFGYFFYQKITFF
jgi:hypothetical protein